MGGPGRVNRTDRTGSCASCASRRVETRSETNWPRIRRDDGRRRGRWRSPSGLPGLSLVHCQQYCKVSFAKIRWDLAQFNKAKIDIFSVQFGDDEVLCVTVLSWACLARSVYAESVSTPDAVLPSQSSHLARRCLQFNVWRHSALWSIRVHCDVTRVHCRQRRERCDRHGWRSLRLVSAPVFVPGRDAIITWRRRKQASRASRASISEK